MHSKSQQAILAYLFGKKLKSPNRKTLRVHKNLTKHFRQKSRSDLSILYKRLPKNKNKKGKKTSYVFCITCTLRNEKISIKFRSIDHINSSVYLFIPFRIDSFRASASWFSGQTYPYASEMKGKPQEEHKPMCT